MQQRQAKPKVRLFLEGRYRKFVRDLPQTVFFCPKCKGRGCRYCDGYGKLTRDSVQELMGRKILPRYKARRGKFHGAGREDLNVRMLGAGRPFVFEVVAPKNLIVDLAEIEDAINDYGSGRIEVTELVPVPRKRVAQLKEAKSEKVYRALVEVNEDIDDRELEALEGRVLEVTQRTPKRVAHRRADRERVRRVEIVAALFDDDQSDRHFEIELRCEHGTYVKEWISGESGRSSPSLADLLDRDTRCLALDVWDVCGPFPKLAGAARPPSFDDELRWPLPRDLSEDRWAIPDDAEWPRDDRRRDERGELAEPGDASDLGYDDLEDIDDAETYAEA